MTHSSLLVKVVIKDQMPLQVRISSLLIYLSTSACQKNSCHELLALLWTIDWLSLLHVMFCKESLHPSGIVTKQDTCTEFKSKSWETLVNRNLSCLSMNQVLIYKKVTFSLWVWLDCFGTSNPGYDVERVHLTWYS